MSLAIPFRFVSTSDTALRYTSHVDEQSHTLAVHWIGESLCNESTKVQTLGVFLGIDRSMSWKQRCYVSVSYVSM